MKIHSDKGRYLIACAILETARYEYNILKTIALECILAYREQK